MTKYQVVTLEQTSIELDVEFQKRMIDLCNAYHRDGMETVNFGFADKQSARTHREVWFLMRRRTFHGEEPGA